MSVAGGCCPCALGGTGPVVLVEVELAQADRFGRDLDGLVLADELEGGLE
jgi:hypothetical protein